MAELRNRSAYHDYFIDDKYDAGMVLVGSEVKALRDGRASFNDSYCYFHRGELYIKSLHIGQYTHSSLYFHEATRDRKLLLTKKELRKLEAKTRERGFSIVPLRIFFNERGFVKLEIGLGRGKKQYDKRETIKARDTEREIKRYIK
jgi:SsrA-binding protein